MFWTHDLSAAHLAAAAAPCSVFALLLVGGVLARFKDWWVVRPLAAPAAPYEVTCACGQVATGLRRSAAQTVRCARCGEELFILPLSRLPEVARGKAVRPTPTAGPVPLHLRPWTLPALAATLTVLLLFAAYVVFFAPAGPGGNRIQPPIKSKPNPEEFTARVAAGRRHLGQGNFRLALADLEAALTLAARDPRVGSRAQRQEAARLHRQAQLLADLLRESLEEVVEHAAGVQEREWQADFPHRYKGKAVVLELDVRPAPGGRIEAYRCCSPVRGEQAQAELDDLALLHRLPLDGPQRVLFGARLTSVGREPGRSWVVRFEPDSGVLLTAAELAILVPDAPELRDLLRRQAEWVLREPTSPAP